jgi:DNA-binding HxlR family transcriptional regulator
MRAMELPANRNCPLARSLEVVGKTWSLLIIREISYGHSRFSQLQSQIGIPPATLTTRLEELVEHKLLDRRSYQDPGSRARDEYTLTDAGRDLIGVLAAFSQWGLDHLQLSEWPTLACVDQATGRRVRLAFLDEGGQEVPREQVSLIKAQSTKRSK